MEKLVPVITSEVPPDIAGLKYIGTILFHDFPAQEVFESGNSEIIIREWADCSDDTTIDRAYFFQTTRDLLSKYLLGMISARNFIYSATGKICWFQDSDNPDALIPIVAGLMPNGYLPDETCYFNSGDGVDVIEIKKHFKID